MAKQWRYKMICTLLFGLCCLIGISGLSTSDSETASTKEHEITTMGHQETSTTFYCNSSFECNDPFTMDSDLSLKSFQCACHNSYLNTGGCCLSHWWIIGLAAGAGAIVLLAFIIALGCCCSYKSRAKKATTAAKKTAEHNRQLERDIETKTEELKTNHSSHPEIPLTTFVASHDSGANHTTAAAAAPSAVHVYDRPPSPAPSPSPSPSPVRPPEVHQPPEMVTHPVVTVAAVSAVVHDTPPPVNRPQDHHPVTQSDPHLDQHPTRHNDPNPTPAQHHPQDYSGGQHHSTTTPPHHQHSPNTSSYHNHHHPDYDNHRTPVTKYSDFVDPYFSTSRTNQQYLDDDNDSLETYDDTAPPTSGLYDNNNYRQPEMRYHSNQEDYRRDSNRKSSNATNYAVQNRDSTSNFVIKRPSVQ